MKVLLSEFHLPRVESAYPCDLILLVNNSRRLPLCLRQNYIDEILRDQRDKKFCENHYIKILKHIKYYNIDI